MGGNPVRELPFFFQKPSYDCVVSAPCSIPYPSMTAWFEYEAELVIALSGPETIYGIGVGVDLTRRDLQVEAKKMQRPWDAAKGFDWAGPVGLLVKTDDVDMLKGKRICLTVNGEVKQNASLDEMIYSPLEIISELSKQFSLKAGDIIFTGTPAGVGRISVGDIVVATIEDVVPECRFSISEPLRPSNFESKEVTAQDKSTDIKRSERPVIALLEQCKDVRFKKTMATVITHLHEAVREIRPTASEWDEFIKILVDTGRITTEKRNEFILLFDLLGISMLVDAISHDHDGSDFKLPPTQSTVVGPFYSPMPERKLGDDIDFRKLKGSVPCYYGGVVRCCRTGNPISNAVIDVWMTSTDGKYSVQRDFDDDHDLYGRFHVNGNGEYWFRGVVPTSYPVPTDGTGGTLLGIWNRRPMRPAHIHFMIYADGYYTLATHIFVGSDPYIAEDAVFGVKPSLIRDFSMNFDENEARNLHMNTVPFAKVTFDINIVPK